MWINKHICGINVRIIWSTLPKSTFEYWVFYLGKKLKHGKQTYRGKRACKIHQRGMEQVNPSICSYLFFITLGNVLDRDNFVGSWSATWHGCCFWRPTHHTGPMKCKELARKRQLPGTARESEPQRCLLQLSPLSTLRNSIPQENSSSATPNSKCSQWKGDHVFCDATHIAEMIQEVLSMFLHWLLLVRVLGSLFFLSRSNIFFFLFSFLDSSSLSSLGCCGVIFFLSSHVLSGK